MGCKYINVLKMRTILTVGRFELQKAYDVNFEACRELLRLREDFEFVWCGEGSLLSEFESLVLGGGLPINFLGQRDDVPELLGQADVFFLPSLYEGCSNAVIEAQLAGVPVVCSDIPENKEFFSGSALFGSSPKQFAAHINSLLNSKKLRNKLIKAGFKNSKSFRIETMVNEYQKIYENQKY